MLGVLLLVKFVFILDIFAGFQLDLYTTTTKLVDSTLYHGNCFGLESSGMTVLNRSISMVVLVLW